MLPRAIGRAVGQKWTVIVTTPAGIRLAVEPSNLDVYTTIMREGGHEPHVVDTCTTLLPPGGVFYDVGASAGYVSLSVARADPGARVFAFEPQRTLAKSLARSARINRSENVVIRTAIVGASDGPGQLYLPSHSVHASTHPPEPGARAVPAEVLRLDSLVAEGAVPGPDVIKIDVEGGERDVLLGAERTISRYEPALVFETIPELTRKFGYEPSDLLSLISSCGDYEFFGIRSDGELVPVGSDPEVRDVVAMPRSRELRASRSMPIRGQ
jgi:FkbM family methyltransferase